MSAPKKIARLAPWSEPVTDSMFVEACNRHDTPAATIYGAVQIEGLTKDIRDLCAQLEENLRESHFDTIDPILGITAEHTRAAVRLNEIFTDSSRALRRIHELSWTVQSRAVDVREETERQQSDVLEGRVKK